MKLSTQKYVLIGLLLLTTNICRADQVGFSRIISLAVFPEEFSEACGLEWRSTPLFMGEGTEDDRAFFSKILGFHIGEPSQELVESADAGISNIYAYKSAISAVGILSFYHHDRSQSNKLYSLLKNRYEGSKFHDVSQYDGVTVLIYNNSQLAQKTCFEDFKLKISDKLG